MSWQSDHADRCDFVPDHHAIEQAARAKEIEDIPQEVVAAAVCLERYFVTQGIRNWELLGCCSRNHADRLHRIKDALQ